MKNVFTEQNGEQNCRHEDTEMLNTVFQNNSQKVVDKVHCIRDERTKILNDQRNTMLGMAVTFLSIALPLYSSLNISEWNRWCLGIAIVSDLFAICMIIAAQRKLPRQMREVVDKATLTMLQGNDLDGEISSSERWYEELCVNYWGVPMVVSIAACLIAVVV